MQPRSEKVAPLRLTERITARATWLAAEQSCNHSIAVPCSLCSGASVASSLCVDCARRGLRHSATLRLG